MIASLSFVAVTTPSANPKALSVRETRVSTLVPLLELNARRDAQLSDLSEFLDRAYLSASLNYSVIAVVRGHGDFQSSGTLQ